MGTAPALRDHRMVRPIGTYAAVGGLVLFAVHQVAMWTQTGELLRVVIFNLAVALPAAWAIGRAARGVGGWIGRILDWGPLRWIGTISYGIYVYHFLLPYWLPWAARRLGRPGFFDPLGHGLQRSIWYPIFYSAVAVAVAALSWYAFERPINRLKDRFQYRVS
jgi:peptidoglycan/LPS O-acetylase OafA/YrhL